MAEEFKGGLNIELCVCVMHTNRFYKAKIDPSGRGSIQQ